jgi:hypothetical protein
MCCVGLTIGAVGSADASEYGIESFAAQLASPQAGEHADFTTTFSTNRDEAGNPVAASQRFELAFPPGISANLASFPKCTAGELVRSGGAVPNEEGTCPIDSQVGATVVEVADLESGSRQTFLEPIYNMDSPVGSGIVSRLGFIAGLIPTFIDIRLDPERNYGLTATLDGLSSVKIVASATTTLWGDPTSPTHDPERITPYEAWNCGGEPCKAPGGQPRHSGLSPTAFMTSPTSCGPVGQARITGVAYKAFQSPSALSAPVLPTLSGCSLLDFSPGISLRPSTEAADSPSGLDVQLTLPQEGLDNPNLLAEGNLKRAVVQLPEGMSLNPAAASGLGACSEAQIGLVSENPVRFNAAPAGCPQASKVGTAEVDTPLLPKTIPGSLYVASQGDNPFHTLLAGYLVAEGEGVLLKLAGRFDTDPRTGQITATFDENPQQPFNSVTLHFNGGDHGVLITPLACGRYDIDSRFSPWSAENPDAPTQSEIVHRVNSFSTSTGPHGGSCPSAQLEPHLEAGTEDPTAGQFSPFALRLTRPDGTDRLRGLSLTLPQGLTGKLADIPYCPDAVLAAIPTALGTGQAEISHPSCPAASQVGTASVGAGAGDDPFFVSTGKVYLAGPYRGAPISLAIVTPAVAGPFDLGSVVVRTAAFVDPMTAQITAVSDRLPTILGGIPLDVRDIRVTMDRHNFTMNPTSCAQKSISGQVQGAAGSVAPVQQRFQAASCASLGFRPKLSLSLKGATKRAGHPALKAVVSYPKKGAYANIARAQVGLPHAEFLDQSNLDKVCTRSQLSSSTCPKNSIYGRVKAWTPLLSQPLHGPVYLGVGFGYKLPALVADLNGQVRILLVGKVDSDRQKGLRNTFLAVPDAPVSRFVLEMKGGKKYGLLENSENICGKSQRASALLTAQNGLSHHLRPKIRNDCGKHRKRHRGRHRPQPRR